MKDQLQKGKRVLVIVSGILAGVAVLVLLSSLLSFLAAPDFEKLATHYPHVRQGKEQSHEYVLKASKPDSWVNYQDISPIARTTIRLSEDWAFFQHEGVDLRELKKSIQKNLEERRYARGASTITQQLAKNIYLSSQKTLRRKLTEVIYAMLIERKVSKRRILELYLNIAEWGTGIYGIKDASLTYFDKHPRFLNAKESAFLAMLLPSPKRYAASFEERQLTEYAQKTVDNLLTKLRDANYLSEEEYQRELQRELFPPAYESIIIFD